MIPHYSSPCCALVAAASANVPCWILQRSMIPSFGFICCARCVWDVTLLFAPSWLMAMKSRYEERRKKNLLDFSAFLEAILECKFDTEATKFLESSQEFQHSRMPVACWFSVQTFGTFFLIFISEVRAFPTPFVSFVLLQKQTEVKKSSDGVARYLVLTTPGVPCCACMHARTCELRF